MDPIANLKEQLELARSIQAIWDDCHEDGTLTPEQSDIVADAANRLAELVLDLDEWIRNGGFSPYTQKGDVTA